jgi:hypothetical protein
MVEASGEHLERRLFAKRFADIAGNHTRALGQAIAIDVGAAEIGLGDLALDQGNAGVRGAARHRKADHADAGADVEYLLDASIAQRRGRRQQHGIEAGAISSHRLQNAQGTA